MKVSSINKFFARFGEFQIRNRRWFLMILVLVSAFCMAGLPRLRLENNEDEWLDNGEQVRIDQNRFEILLKQEIERLVVLQRRKKEAEVTEWERQHEHQNDQFYFIAGYTPGGAPYGVTWEEMGLKPWEEPE